MSVGKHEASKEVVMRMARSCGKVSALASPDSVLRRDSAAYSAVRHLSWYGSAAPSVCVPPLDTVPVLLALSASTCFA